MPQVARTRMQLGGLLRQAKGLDAPIHDTQEVG